MVVFKMQRKAVTANTEYAFKFDVTGREFLVKNLTEGDVYVGFTKGENNSERLLIPAGTAQVVTGMIIKGSDTIYIFSTVTHGKGVEVQCLSW